MITNPVLKYYGGKFRLARWIISHFPIHDSYVEPFGGGVNVSQIRDLGHVVEREKAAIGIFLTLEKPTKPMIEEAIGKGFYHSDGWNKDYPKIQILTVEDVLNGKQPDLPPNIQTFKKAERAVTDDPAVVAQRLLPEF